MAVIPLGPEPKFKTVVFEYSYPTQPAKLKLFSKYGYVSRPKTGAVRYLEHMLTKTTLTTQKAVHSNIEGKGIIVITVYTRL